MSDDKLERYIKENREQFDRYEPDSFVWEKIERDMQPKSRMDWRIVLTRVAGVAAIFAVAFLTSEFIHREREDGMRNDRIVKKIKEIVIPELQEAEAYYAGIVNEKLAEMKLLASDHPDIEKELQDDFTELDSIYLELKNDLRDNIANQEVINAIIEIYRLRIEILEDMLSELNPDRNVSEPKNEGYDL